MTFAEIEQTGEWQHLALPARGHYSDELPYHNWRHPLAVAKEVVALANRCGERGLHLDTGQLAVAAAWHDAEHHRDPRAAHHVSKESHSADLAREYLLASGQTENYANEIAKAIIGTTHGVRRGLNAIALHRADIANIGGPYGDFAICSYRLLLERRVNDPELTFDKYVAKSGEVIKELADESLAELATLGEPTSGTDSWPEQALANLKRLQTETEASLENYPLAASVTSLIAGEY
jgi:hypothetical protein